MRSDAWTRLRAQVRPTDILSSLYRFHLYLQVQILLFNGMTFGQGHSRDGSMISSQNALYARFHSYTGCSNFNEKKNTYNGSSNSNAWASYNKIITNLQPNSGGQ